MGEGGRHKLQNDRFHVACCTSSRISRDIGERRSTMQDIKASKIKIIHSFLEYLATAAMAWRYMCIPATSVQSERLFSATCRLI